MAKSFFDEIKGAVVEREVEFVYQKGINLYFPNVDITHPFACDGMISTKSDNGKILKLIIEYKLDEEMTSRIARAKVIIQVIYYLKRFEDNGLILPNVCMIGDKNECFVMHTNDIINYLNRDGVDWTIAPSEAYKFNQDFVLDIANDEKINPFIFEINEHFSFKVVADKIKDLADNVQRYVRVTEHNIANIYDYFIRNVIKNTKKICSHDLVGTFIGVISDKDNYYQHPTKNNILVTPLGNIDINGNGFKSFFAYFDRTYTPQEKNKFSEIADRLIEDTDRRNNGDFWTPTIWVDYAHKMIENELGENWKDECVVWDCAAGSGNLTRDYKFNELYCSTLFESEIEIGKKYNKESEHFQFDFLNDYIPMGNELVKSESKLPNRLIEAFEQNKKIMFFINPPYATAGNYGETSKKDCAKTMINEQMLNDKIGACSQNLYAQFLYRIMKIKQAYNLTNAHIAIFCPSLFLTGSSYKEFRKHFLKEFAFADAIQFKASHFADVSDSWGISFSLWDCGETKDKNNFSYKCCDIDGEEVVVTENKVVYNIDGLKTGLEWIKTNVKNDCDLPHLSSGITVKGNTGKGIKNMFGYYYNDGTNNVDKNTQGNSIFSTIFSNGHGVSILPQNFSQCVSLFAARRLVQKNWINWADEYLAPNEQHNKFQEFVNDSIIYSLFESKSNQSSLRQIDYKGKKWDIKNEFFWLSSAEIAELANEYNLDYTYNDAKTMPNRYVYNKLQDITLSSAAQAVLDKENELVRTSFKYRELFNEEHPEYQILNADCGWYQIKAMLKEYMPNELKEFQSLFKELADKMRPMVYELGFLK